MPSVLFAEISAPPYQVVEEGWGEFEIGIKIFLRDPSAEPISLTTKLRLHALPPNPPNPPDTPIIEEVYDEIVFNEAPANVQAREALLAGPCRLQSPYSYQEWFSSYSGEADVARVAAARQFLQDRKVELEERLLRTQAAIEREKDELKSLGVL